VTPPRRPTTILRWSIHEEDATEANHALAERRGSGGLILPGLLGTPFAGWSKAKAAPDKAVVDARAKAAAASGKSPTALEHSRSAPNGCDRLAAPGRPARSRATDPAANVIALLRSG
jgi:hypothetical protein